MPGSWQGQVEGRGGAAARQLVFRRAVLACSMNVWVSGPAQAPQLALVSCPWPGRAPSVRRTRAVAPMWTVAEALPAAI